MPAWSRVSDVAKVIISVTDDRLSSLSSVASELTSRGMSIEQTLDEIGTIVGSVDDAGIAALKSVPGVAAVEVEGDDLVGRREDRHARRQQRCNCRRQGRVRVQREIDAPRREQHRRVKR